ncbi:P-loop containing nucleoside triphosphate hydrolase protein [Neohortaea acidophila]|uniref:P-loop containing nucleoside triphosphate hydrolase protein n=1 Tax=Neohortaea acidophila TaxID=245834 RepID=A0A6A6Q2L9_9PEZI|nr:P-loop containing nucleoside triphosphate hydrolase protein [Neohortaea acidophila]KAF2486640.1 P-loop containing nucleoside triphosphate hydrolase protein [Neohortaea acidophila]
MSLTSPAGPINPDEAPNYEEIEKQFAVKVVEHMNTYWAILEKIPGSKLRLTKCDDEILEHFNKEFPDFDLKATINEDEMKSKDGKEKWRTFINAYENKIEDYNFGTIIRANPAWEYGEKETIFAVRMQFYAIEIARETSTDDKEDDISAPWRALFFFTTRANVPVLVAGALASIISGAVLPAQSFVTGRVFDRLTIYAAGQLTKHDFMQQEKNYVLYLLIISGVSWIALYAELALWVSFGELQAKSARDRLFYGLLKKEIAWYDLRKHGIAALLPRLQTQIRALQLATSQPLGVLASTASTALLSLIQAVVLSWKLTLVTLSTTPLVILGAVWIGRGMQKAFDQQSQLLTEAQKHAANAFSAIETVKCFNGQHVEEKKYATTISSAAQWYFRAAHSNALQLGLVVLLSVSMFVQGFYYGGILIARGETSTADVITTFMSAINAFQAINSVLPQLIVLEKGRNAGSMLRAVMADMQYEYENRRVEGNLVPASCRGDIEVKNLTFSYPSRPEQPALQNVSLYIPGGEMTFLVGRSGSGKSTLGQLLMRFYLSSHGRVSLDGYDLDVLEVGWLRNNTTLVEQTSSLFNDTVFQNIALGKREAGVTSVQVDEAAQFALLRSMIYDLPNGMQTLVGYKGSSLSGGQRQRVALARARIRDTPILILDESTSALDHISRALMMDAIREWRRGKSTIVITHDISQILSDDYVYVLEQGSLVQEGYRKHMERLKDTPFQGFLTEGPETITAPQDLQQRNGLDYTTMQGFTQNRPSRPVSYAAYDPLEAQFEAFECKRSSVLPTLFQEGSPLIGLRLRNNALASPWMRSPPWALPGDISPTAPSSGDWTETEGLALINDAGTKRSSKRLSNALENFVQRTGRMAAASRMTTDSPRQRQRVDLDAIAAKSYYRTKETQRNTCAAQPSVRTQSLRQILSTLWPHVDWRARACLITGFIGASIHAVSTPVFSFVLSKLLKLYSIPGGDSHRSLIYSMVILGISCVDAFSTYVFHFSLEYAGQCWIDSIRTQAMKKILDQPRAFFDEEENAVSRLTGCLDRNAEEMRNLLGRFSALVWIAALMCTVSVIWAMLAQWKMALVALATAPYIFGVTKAFSVVSEKWEKLSNDASDDAAAIFTETFTNIKTVRALTLEQRFIDKYTKATDYALRIGFRRAFFAGFFYGLADSAGNLSIAMIYYVGAWLVTRGASAESIVEVFVLLVFAITNLNAILEYIPQITASKDLASRVLRLAQLPTASHEHMGNTRIHTVGDIAFNDLQFSYPSRAEQTVLKHLSLHIHPGTCTAIVGGSGSGKSTIASLLLNLYTTQPHFTAGFARANDLVLAGRNIKRIDTSSLRSLIVPVSQTPTLFPATVAENIAYGLPSTSPYNNPAQISAAAALAGIHDFIESLPHGYATVIGDGGIGLSGGQAQRVAIARALVRKPAVLILDEATSALDVESAGLVRLTIERLVRERDQVSGGGMTVIIITHSREMMEIAESVVVLENGRVVEQGGFDDLLRRNGALVNLLSGGEWTGDREGGK